MFDRIVSVRLSFHSISEETSNLFHCWCNITSSYLIFERYWAPTGVNASFEWLLVGFISFVVSFISGAGPWLPVKLFITSSRLVNGEWGVPENVDSGWVLISRSDSFFFFWIRCLVFDGVFVVVAVTWSFPFAEGSWSWNIQNSSSVISSAWEPTFMELAKAYQSNTCPALFP